MTWTALNGRRVADVTIVHQLDAGTGGDLDSVRSALRVLTRRHAVLRTRFTVSPGGPVGQAVVDGAVLDIRSLPDLQHGSVLLMRTEIAYGGGHASLDPEREAPICLVYQRVDRRWGCILVAPHLAIDGFGAGVLTQEYQALVGGSPVAGLPPAVDPLAIVELETRPERVARGARNLDRIRSILRRTGPDQLIVQPSAIAGRLSATKARSEQFGRHLDELSRRYGVPKSGVVTGLISLLDWQGNGHSPVLLWLLHRLSPPGGAAYVGTNTIGAFTVVDVDPALDAASFLRRTWASCVHAFRTSSYNPAAAEELLVEIGQSHGSPRVNGLICLNFHLVPDELDWGPLKAPVDGEILEHGPVPAAAYRSLFDVKVGTKAATVAAMGVEWPGVGDTKAQCRALMRLAELMVVGSGDQRLPALLAGLPG